jgi:hypothetical protein
VIYTDEGGPTLGAEEGAVRRGPAADSVSYQRNEVSFMRRRTFDVIASGVGLLLAVLLAVAGALLIWAYTFVDNEVHSQLSAQKIFFPAADSQAITSLPANDAAAMKKYAGQQMTNGAQAKTYADHFIAVHLNEIGGGKTYSELSAQLQKDPTNQKLQTQVETVFKGETLRGLLLNAYAFWQMGQIAKWAAIVAFAGAAVMLVLSILGFLHVRRTPVQQELLAPPGTVPAAQP